MPLTTNGLPYPADSAAPNVPADIQALAEALDPQAAPTIWAHFQRTTNQTIQSSVLTPVVGTLLTASGVGYNASSGAMTIGTNGLYLLTGWITWLVNATGIRAAYWYRGNPVGSAARLSRAMAAGSAAGQVTTTNTHVIRCVAGDVLWFQAYQTVGSPLDLDGTLQSTGFEVARISP